MEQPDLPDKSSVKRLFFHKLGLIYDITPEGALGKGIPLHWIERIGETERERERADWLPVRYIIYTHLCYDSKDRKK